MENYFMPEVAFKKVTSKGKKYVYLRGSNIALVRGFLGTDAELDSLLASRNIAEIIEAQATHVNSTVSGWRTDAANMMHRSTRGRSVANNRPYQLSVEIITKLLSDADDRCQLTGIRFDYGPKTEDLWKSRPLAPSLDRISNKGGYQLDNVRLVCVCVNIAINQWGLANFERVCRAFVGRNGK